MTIRHFTYLLLASGFLSSIANAEKFPFADGTFDENNKLVQWSLERVRKYRDDTIGKLTNDDGTPKGSPEKDAAADPMKLNGYPSPKVESKEFTTDIDLTDLSGLVYVAIHVDDIANLTVTEIDDAGEPIGTPITYNVKGSALWRAEKSYKEFPNPIRAGKKYRLNLDYTNTVNLTDKYNGLVDYDGVNVFLIHRPAVDIEILSVPEFLYANATYATPIKFQVKNVKKAKISSIEVEFYDGSSTYKYPIKNRFVADDGPDQNNGTSNVYTCFVPSSFYLHSLVENTFTREAQFKVKVKFKDLVDDPSWEREILSERHYISGYFADSSMKYLVEIGAGENFLPAAPGPGYDGKGALLFEVLKSDVDRFPVGSTYDPALWNLPGFNNDQQDEAFCNSLSSATSFGAHAKLYDSDDIRPDSNEAGQAYKARAYGMRKGGLVYISYQGRAMETGILQEGELAMDLSKRTTNLDCTLFDSVPSHPDIPPSISSYSTLVISERGDALESTLNLASGATGIAACWLYANPVWAAALGTTAIIAGFVAAHDVDTINAAEVSIRQVTQIVRNDGSIPGPAIRDIFRGWANSPAHTAQTSVADNGRFLRVGDQYVLYVEMNVGCTAESYRASFSHAEAKAKWECDSGSLNAVKVNALAPD